MIRRSNETFVVVVFSIVLTGLFHKQVLGLNLFIAEFIFLLWLVITKQFQWRGHYAMTLGLGVLLTSVATVITHSVFSYFLNFIVLFVFIGFLIYPQTKSLLNAFGQSFSNISQAQIQFFKGLAGLKLKNRKIGNYIWRFRIFLLPLLIINFFVFIYRISNPVFDELVGDAILSLQDKWDYLFEDFDFLIIITFIICLLISVFMVIRTSNKQLINMDLSASEELIRTRLKSRKQFRMNALKNEYRSGVFLLIILNAVLLILNVIDVNWVWFGFEWEGQYLKQFVHEGTYLLILSILTSVVVVLYYFRDNLNFYEQNRMLKVLSYLWLIQNGVLAISVGIRNFWYIHHFALAYKRIGVIIFLVMTIYGLSTVFIKLWRRKSSFYLFKVNSYSILVILMISSTLNWDIIIARYNFNNATKSFLHLDYLSTLSDKALPHLNVSLSELKRIEFIQKEKFPFEEKFMTPEDYFKKIESRKAIFKERWESKGFLSWNWPEYRAYRMLFKANAIHP